MEKNKYEREYKHVISLLNEKNKLFDLKYQIKSIKLDKPIRHGFVRFLRVRNEYLDKKGIVDAFNFCGHKKVYSKNKNFIVKHKKHTYEKHPYMHGIKDPRFCLFWSPEQQSTAIANIEQHKKYLISHNSGMECDCWKNRDEFLCKNKFTIHYAFRLPWALEEITQDHYLTHYKPIDSELESKLKRIENEISHNQYYRWVSRRFVGDKLDKERQLSIKYSDDKIYHSDDDEFIDS